MTKPTNGTDSIANALGNMVGLSYMVGSNFATPTANGGTLTGVSGLTTNALVGQMILVTNATPANSCYGVVLSNTTTAVTVDFWHQISSPATVATTPTAGSPWYILPGQAPAAWIALSTSTFAQSTAHQYLTSNGTNIDEVYFAGGGLNRALATYSHTTGTSTFTLTKTFTANANDTGSNVINKMGVFIHGLPPATAPTTANTGTMVATLVVSNPPTLVNGDSIQITFTGTIA